MEKQIILFLNFNTNISATCVKCASRRVNASFHKFFLSLHWLSCNYCKMNSWLLYHWVLWRRLKILFSTHKRKTKQQQNPLPQRWLCSFLYKHTHSGTLMPLLFLLPDLFTFWLFYMVYPFFWRNIQVLGTGQHHCFELLPK